MNDSRLNKKKRKTPPTKLKNLNEIWNTPYLIRGTAIVYISDDDEYYAGTLVGFSIAQGGEDGGYILDDYPTKNGTGLVEWGQKGGEHLYPLHDRYNELLEYLNGEHDDESSAD